MNRIWTAIVVILCSGMLFFQSALAEAGDLKIVRPESMTIVDRTGKTLGPFTLQFGTFSYAVLFSVKGRIFKLGVNRDGYRADDYLWFESPDCTGPPLMRQWDTILPPVALGAPGNTVYTGAAGAQPAVANLMSERVAEGCIFVGSIPISVVPAEPLIDLDTEFTPPFRIRTGGGH